MSENIKHFSVLNSINVKDKIEQKNGKDYLPWASAWAIVKSKFPDAKYEIKKFGENQLPYTYDDKTGYIVFTEMTIEEVTHEMWLPVLDGANKPMFAFDYQYKTKNGVKSVSKADMFDINKAIMRCLVKNIALFGLGLYIYEKDDLPTTSTDLLISWDEEIKNIKTIEELNKFYKDNKEFETPGMLEILGKRKAEIKKETDNENS